jgi:hypothetical protein
MCQRRGHAFEHRERTRCVGEEVCHVRESDDGVGEIDLFVTQKVTDLEDGSIEAQV